MKRFFRLSVWTLAVAVCTPGLGQAARTVYNQALANEAGLAYNNTYALSVDSFNIDTLTMIAVYSSATVAAVTFNDGSVSTGSITVSSYTALHGTLGTNTLTVVSGKNNALAARAATDTLTVVKNTTAALQGASFNLNGTTLINTRDWLIAPSSPSITATNIANTINANTIFTATTSSNVVTITCPVVGYACNAYTLVSSTNAALAASGSTFSGGQDAVYYTLKGTILTNGTDWPTGFSSTNTATSIATSAGTVTGFTATASSNVVTISCSSSGTFCNAYTLATSSAAALSRGGTTFSGGANQAIFSLGGNILTEGVDFNAITSSAVTAANIKTAINANTALSAIVTASTGPAGVVVTTSTSVGANTRYSLWASTYAALTPFAPAMRGGTDSSINTTSSLFTVASHGLTRALPVLYTKTSGTTPTGLTVNTTYYAIPVTAGTFRLSTTSTGAVAGANLTVTAQTGSGSFKLTPLGYTGTAGFFWEASNDGSNFNPVDVSSVTYSSPSSTATSTLWDFGKVNFSIIRLNVTAPSTGGLTLVVTGVGRSDK